VLTALLLALQAERIEPRTASWDVLAREVFDPAWILPEGLPLAPGEKGLALELEVELARLVGLVAEPSADDPGAPRGFGDLVAASRGLDRAGLVALLARFERAQPELGRTLAPLARELLADEGLRARRWNPEEDRADDGILLARPLTLAGVDSAPWSELRGSRLVQQGAALVRADLAAIKAVENDFPRYPGRPGTSYESIVPVPGSHLRGLDPAGRPFAALRVRFESDLPFPFSSYACDLRILNRVRADGRVACDIASPSRDFYWMAGRDLFLPVRASDGSFQGELVVRLFGFDLRGVPDGDEARRAGLRASLGSLKREAEALYLERGMGGAPSGGVLPDFVVIARR
jgi:hypothetical protein